MKFKRFEIIVFVLIIAIVILTFLFTYSFHVEHLQFSVYYFGSILLILITSLFLKIKNHNQKFIDFLKNVKYDDNLLQLDDKKGSNSNKQLQVVLNELADIVNNARLQEKSSKTYFNDILKFIDVGIISYNDNGDIEVFNDKVRQLLKIDSCNRIQFLEEKFEQLVQVIHDLKPGRSSLTQLEIENQKLELSIGKVKFKKNDQIFYIITLKDIQNELQQEEIETWQKLIRVLTHEIMNSAGPIQSLSSTLIDSFIEIDSKIDKTERDNIKIGLSAIKKRSEGLNSFVQTYRSLTKIPQPIFSTFKLENTINEIVQLFHEKIEESKIKVSIEINPNNLEVLADEKLISQVFINVLKNAIESTFSGKNPEIKISASILENKSVEILFIDNGKGISDENLEQIFIPFFTTKESGSGIGLSLSRQIMLKHKGTIYIQSQENKGTTVQIII
jgi:nitrogen fixation/metabolism regulation signal transduction histidine kinase